MQHDWAAWGMSELLELCLALRWSCRRGGLLSPIPDLNPTVMQKGTIVVTYPILGVGTAFKTKLNIA